MAQFPWLRSSLNRLTFLSRPVPLASTLGILLLSIFLWEYSRNPEWFGSFAQDDGASPEGAIDLSTLTPAAQAAIADIDNLSVLMNELGVESGGVPTLQAIAIGQDEGENAIAADLLSLSQPGNINSENPSTSIFNQYLEQYQFGRQRPTNIPQASANSFTNGTATTVGQSPLGSPSLRISPLALALQGQNALIPGTQPSNQTVLEAALQSQNTSETATTTDGTNAEATTESTLPAGEFSSEVVTIPGVAFPVLPTLPQMSPPPGTTGYTPPASLDLMPPLPGSNSAGTLPSSTAPLSTVGGVSGSSSGTAVPNLNTPQVDVSNGYTPYTPVVPSATPTTPGVTPSPYAVPRPPGSYIGGGYINTFSNPSGPPN
ncbi:MAG: hypothetical protein ACFB0G_06600 [Leptolyngbyaceae cyanobacterium]